MRGAESQEQARNILGTCLQHPCYYGGTSVVLVCCYGLATTSPAGARRRGSACSGVRSTYLLRPRFGKLVRDFAIPAGLTDTGADEVVQETAIAMARHLPGYRYDPKVCRFKTWLLNQASWRTGP